MFSFFKNFIEVTENKYKSRWIFLTSGDNDNYPGCKLSIAIFKKYISIKLPTIIKPYKNKVLVTHGRDEYIKSKGQDWYYEYIERHYGISYFNNYISINYGIVDQGCMNELKEQRKMISLPWLEYRFTQYNLYDLDHKIFWKSDGSFNFYSELEQSKYDQQIEAEKRCPKAIFEFEDIDKEICQVTTYIQERVWLRGEGYFKWLSKFYEPLIRISLNLEFDREVGPQKGNYKGGILSTGVDVISRDIHYYNCATHTNTFKRYCEDRYLTFIRRIR